MNIELSEEAVEFGHLALRALEEAGGDHLAAAAELEPGRRERLVTPILSDLGVWQLNPRGDQAELEADSRALPKRRLLGGPVPNR